MEQMYSQATIRGGFGDDSLMAGFYVRHNAGIGIQCFASGIILCGFGGMFAVIFNACLLGAVFGYMDTTSAAGNFNEAAFLSRLKKSCLDEAVVTPKAAKPVRNWLTLLLTGALAAAATGPNCWQLTSAGREANVRQ